MKIVKKDEVKYILKCTGLDKNNIGKQTIYLASEMIFLEHFKNKWGRSETNKIVNIFGANFNYKDKKISFLVKSNSFF